MVGGREAHLHGHRHTRGAGGDEGGQVVAAIGERRDGVRLGVPAGAADGANGTGFVYGTPPPMTEPDTTNCGAPRSTSNVTALTPGTIESTVSEG